MQPSAPPSRPDSCQRFAPQDAASPHPPTHGFICVNLQVARHSLARWLVYLRFVFLCFLCLFAAILDFVFPLQCHPRESFSFRKTFLPCPFLASLRLCVRFFLWLRLRRAKPLRLCVRFGLLF